MFTRVCRVSWSPWGLCGKTWAEAVVAASGAVEKNGTWWCGCQAVCSGKEDMHICMKNFLSEVHETDLENLLYK